MSIGSITFLVLFENWLVSENMIYLVQTMAGIIYVDRMLAGVDNWSFVHVCAKFKHQIVNWVELKYFFKIHNFKSRVVLNKINLSIDAVSKK